MNVCKMLWKLLLILVVVNFTSITVNGAVNSALFSTFWESIYKLNSQINSKCDNLTKRDKNKLLNKP